MCSSVVTLLVGIAALFLSTRSPTKCGTHVRRPWREITPVRYPRAYVQMMIARKNAVRDFARGRAKRRLRRAGDAICFTVASRYRRSTGKPIGATTRVDCSHSQRLHVRRSRAHIREKRHKKQASRKRRRRNAGGRRFHYGRYFILVFSPASRRPVERKRRADEYSSSTI